MQLFYDSHPGMEGMLYDVESVRPFAGVTLSGPIPDDTTILNRDLSSRRGRSGLPCEVVLRCGMILKQLWQADYRNLEFALLDSASARHFARVDPLRPPKKSALQKSIGSVRAEVWERISRTLVDTARGGKVETGR